MKFRKLLFIVPLFIYLNIYADITLDPETTSTDQNGGGAAVLTFGQGVWYASSDSLWLTMITDREDGVAVGNAGGSMAFMFAANNSADTRSATITVTNQNGDILASHTVIQSGNTANLVPSSSAIDRLGGQITTRVEVLPNVSWTAVSNDDWISIVNPTGIGTGDLNFNVASYGGVSDRTGTITIGGAIYSVTQSGMDVNVFPVRVDKDSDVGIITATVSSLFSTSWSVSSDSSWITIIDPGAGNGDDEVLIAVASNPSYLARSGNVSIGSANIEIWQDGLPSPVLDLIPYEATADPTGGYGNIAVMSTPDAPWQSQALNSWINIASGENGTGNGNIEYVVSPNPTLDTRIGRIKVTPPHDENLIDITRGVIGWYKGRDDLSGWERHLENAADNFVFDGRTKVYVNTFGFGDNSYHRSTNDSAISLVFKIDDTNTLHRLIAFDNGNGTAEEEATLYVSESNTIAVSVHNELFDTGIPVSTNTYTHVAITQDADNKMSIYAGELNSDIASSIAEFTFSNPFFASTTNADDLMIGHSNYPSPGVLSGELHDIKIYNRELNRQEIEALNTTSITPIAYSRYKAESSSTTLAEAQIAAANSNRYIASPETDYELNLYAHFGEDSLQNLSLDEAVNPGSGWTLGVNGNILITPFNVNNVNKATHASGYAFHDYETFNSSGENTDTNIYPNGSRNAVLSVARLTPGDNTQGYMYYDPNALLSTETFNTLKVGSYNHTVKQFYMKIGKNFNDSNVIGSAYILTSKNLDGFTRKAGEDPTIKEDLKAFIDGDFNFNEGDSYTPKVYKTRGSSTTDLDFSMNQMRGSFNSYNNISDFDYSDKNFNFHSQNEFRHTLGGANIPVMTYSTQDLSEPIESIKPSGETFPITGGTHSPKLKPLVYTIQNKGLYVISDQSSGWENVGNYIESHNGYTIRNNILTYDGSLDGIDIYLSEAEIPASVIDEVRNNYEFTPNHLFRSSFKGNGATDTRLPFRLTNATPATDRNGIAYNAIEFAEFGTSEGSAILDGAQSAHESIDATYAMWFKLDRIPVGTVTLFDRTQSGPGGPSLTLLLTDNGNTLKLSHFDGTVTEEFTMPIDLQVQEFHHLVFSCNDDVNVKIILDGEEIGNTSKMYGYKFGKWDESFQILTLHAIDGVWDDFAAYDTALSVSEIKAIYDEEKPRVYYHTITQGEFTASISPEAGSVIASGGSVSFDLITPSNITWEASSDSDWVTLESPLSGVGPVTVQATISPNPTIHTRTATITIAGNTFNLSQSGLGVNLTINNENIDEYVFEGTSSSSVFIDVQTEAEGGWEPSTDVNWITLSPIGNDTSGNGSLMVIVSPYADASSSRTAAVNIGDETIYITQRGYQISVDPLVAEIGSNNGTGEFGVAAPIGSIWQAIVTEPWIQITSSTNGSGDGIIRYELLDNNTGETRTGKIIVSGTEYTINQVTQQNVTVSTSGTGGTTSGSGGYNPNDTATITANADIGYTFSHWTGDAVGSENPLLLNIDSDKEVYAHFIPNTAAVALRSTAVSDIIENPEDYNLYSQDQLQDLALGAPVISKDAVTGKVTIGINVKESSDLEGEWTEIDLENSDVSIYNNQIEINMDANSDKKFFRFYPSE